MILNQQVSELVQDVHDDMTNGQAGTDTTLFVKTQTGLITAVGATDLTLSDKTFTTASVSVTHVISTTVGNSNDLAEFEVNNGTYSYNRSVKSAIGKTTAIEITLSHNFEFVVI